MSYKESDIESASDVEEEEEGTELSDEGAKAKGEDENSQTIEKIMEHRIGKKGGMLSIKSR